MKRKTENGCVWRRLFYILCACCVSRYFGWAPFHVELKAFAAQIKIKNKDCQAIYKSLMPIFGPANRMEMTETCCRPLNPTDSTHNEQQIKHILLFWLECVKNVTARTMKIYTRNGMNNLSQMFLGKRHLIDGWLSLICPISKCETMQMKRDTFTNQVVTCKQARLGESNLGNQLYWHVYNICEIFQDCRTCF